MNLRASSRRVFPDSTPKKYTTSRWPCTGQPWASWIRPRSGRIKPGPAAATKSP